MENEKEILKEIERWKILAEILLKEDKRVYIRDVHGNFYFADLLLVGEDTLEIQCFAPENREGQKFVLYWANVIKFDEYKKERATGGGK
jgi:hypothetical protein